MCVYVIAIVIKDHKRQTIQSLSLLGRWKDRSCYDLWVLSKAFLIRRVDSIQFGCHCTEPQGWCQKVKARASAAYLAVWLQPCCNYSFSSLNQIMEDFGLLLLPNEAINYASTEFQILDNWKRSLWNFFFLENLKHGERAFLKYSCRKIREKLELNSKMHK